jgi:voltage-gated potassium channel
MRWYGVVLALVAYSVSSWLFLYFSHETSLTQWPDFIYWLLVTSSTVGYGDLSPTTDMGKYVVALYVIPVGLSLFALIIGRIAAFISDQWTKGVRGLKALQTSNHILVIGWNNERTTRLLNLLLTENKLSHNPRSIVLCVRKDIENPMPDKIDFVKVSSFNKDEDMDKACLDSASVVIIDNPEDDLTMTTALYVYQRNSEAHIVAYFTDESLVGLLQNHCPNVECMPSVAVEMIAKSAFDPGSSMLHFDLLSNVEGQTQFSVQVPDSISSIKIETLFRGLKKHYNATLIGIHNGEHIQLNPNWEASIQSGNKLFYIAARRISPIDWTLLNGHLGAV